MEVNDFVSVLYVEDDKDTQEMFTTLFFKQLSNLIVASNGEEGLELFKKHNPDIIITDIEMPLMGGFEMIEEIRKINSKVVAIVISAFDDSKYLHQAIDHNVIRYVVKPLNKIYFTQILQESIELVTLRKEKERREQELRDAYYQIENSFQVVDKHLISSEVGLDKKITYISEAYSKISGYSKDELLGRTFAILRDPKTNSEIYVKMWEGLSRGETWSGELSNIDKNGHRYWMRNYIKPKYDVDHKLIGYTQIAENITSEKLLEQMATTDQLTQIYNRNYLDSSLQKEMVYTNRYLTPFSVILIDIDKFKSVNDTFGHVVGDSVLQEFAQILHNKIREIDILGRWGGEEFLIILPQTNLQSAARTAEKLRESVEQYEFTTIKHATASFGVSTYRIKESDDELIIRADRALYKAKNSGRNRVEVESE